MCSLPKPRQPSASHPVNVGQRTEATILAELVKRGYRVLLPFGANHRYDLVIDLDGSFVRVQCKTGRLRNGCILFHAVSIRSNTTKVLTRGYRGEADVFLVYCAETEQVYAVDVEDVGACEVKLRVAPTANNQERGIRWAADYLLPA